MRMCQGIFPVIGREIGYHEMQGIDKGRGANFSKRIK
jgi:hypothetical protein